MCSENNLIISKMIFVRQSEQHDNFRVIIEGKELINQTDPAKQ